MFKTKYDAVEFFEWSKELLESDACLENKECGILFKDKYALVLCGDAIGRTEVDDNLPLTDFLYWSYKDEDSITRMNSTKNYKQHLNIGNHITPVIGNDFYGDINILFDRHYGVDFKTDISELRDFIKNNFKTTKKRIVSAVEIISKDNIIDCKILKGRNKTVTKTLNLNLVLSDRVLDNRHIADGSFIVNMEYLYQVLNKSFTNSVVRFKFNPGDKKPLILLSEHGDIKWAIGRLN
ncbi:MAG: hypothetical protein RR420_01440 [Anaerovoracaceae bacterium]